MQLCTAADALLRKPHAENSPTVAVYFGGSSEEDSPVGLARVTVPARGGMPPHRHSGSEVILVPTRGRVLLTREGGQELTVEVGDAALIGRYEAVALTNPDDAEAEVIVAAGPSNFVAGLRNWPAA